MKAAREDVIVFAVGGYKLAIAAGAVKEIRGMDDLHPFKLGGISAQIAKLKYTLERNGTTYFVVDAAQHFRLPAIERITRDGAAQHAYRRAGGFD